jgi:hypothetical protein
MLNAVIGFIELGGIILAWTIFWNFVIRGFTANHSDSPAAQGLAAVYHA